MVEAAIPTEIPTSVPDLEATIAAAVQATAAAQEVDSAAEPMPTALPTPTTTLPPTMTPIPSPTIPVPTPTSAPNPTATPVPQATYTPLPAPTPTLAQMIEDIELSLVYIETSSGSGTGFIIDEDGIVVTNAHVIENFKTVTVVLADGREYDGNVLGIDEIADLAIVELNTTRKFEAMPLANSDDVRVGDDVIALGFPLSYELGTSLTVTRGIISSKRDYSGLEEFQTDAAINPGNSGGPLVNRDGKVVGVNYAELSLSDGSPVDNIGFSIAINELKDRMDSLIRGENTLLPTLTPGQWSTYQNDDYGYELEIAPGWYLDEEASSEDATFWSEDSKALIQIFTYDLDRNWTLEEHAESERDSLEEQAREQSWDVFEITSFQKMQYAGREYYHLAYRWRTSTEYCISNDIVRIFLSGFYPSKPYGFAIYGRICEDSLDRYSDEHDPMLESFLEWEPHLPTPSTEQWTIYQNNDYGYQLEIAPNWYLDEEASSEDATFWSEDSRALIQIFAYDLDRSWTLEEHAELERDSLEEQAREQAWDVFEITSFQKRQDSGREYYHLAYRLQESAEYCVSEVIARVFMSDFHPSKPYGFVIESGACEDSLDLYGDELDAILESFLEREPHLPTPTPASWTTYRNDKYDYGIDIAPGWRLEEETDDGKVSNTTFWNEDSSGLLDISAYSLSEDYTLKDLADWLRDILVEQAQENSWDVFEITSFQKRQDNAREHYHLAYRWQSSDEYCVSDVVDRVFMSDFFPSKPYGFVVESSVCEDSLDLYGGELEAMLESFDP